MKGEEERKQKSYGNGRVFLMYLMIAQTVGIVGMILVFLSFQINSKKNILFFQILSSLVFGVHFFMLNAFTGVAMNAVSIFRNSIFYQSEKHAWARHKAWIAVFILLYTGMGLLTWDNWFSILLMISMVTTTFAFWETNPTRIRLLYFPGSPCWLVYNITNGSVAGIITESFSIISLIIAFIRFDILHQEEKAKI